ncbi:LIV-II [Moraxella caviae]|nr:LIV-II [Moraxella caviae]VEW11437.1 LIV-II [Moraxella caviae]VEW14048.1 LIV-II [Moraxella caviae]
MLFAIFFGAGNLIFPPKLGLEMGSDFLPAITGFILTGVGLPLATIVISSLFTGGYKQALDHISPAFSLVFLVAVYLALGPGFGIPRTAATAYDMAITPLLSAPSTLMSFGFTALYFIAATWLSLNPSKMVDRVGSILTPVLLLFIFGLVVLAVPHFAGVTPAVMQHSAPFAKGVVEGYFTLDILAAMAFSVIVISAIKSQGVSGKALTRQTTQAGLIAAILLVFVYAAIGWIGNKMPADTALLAEAKGQNVGTFILHIATEKIFGTAGQSVLAIIVLLACLTSAVGLITAISQYFSQVFTRFSYRTYVYIFALISFILANRGLDAVITTSVPVLLILYPIAITVLIALMGAKLWRMPLLAQRAMIALVVVISIISTVGEKLGMAWIAELPLKSASMEWLPFAIVGALIGYALAWVRKSWAV